MRLHYYILAIYLGAMMNPLQAKQWNSLDGKAPLVIGHRGAPGYLPDHTLEGYTRAAQMGADFIEPDLVSTKDGVLIARHEPNLKDTTDIADRPEFAAYKHVENIDGKDEEGWFAADLTYAQIQTLRAKQPRADRDASYNGKFIIPTFEQILTLRDELSKKLGREIGVYPETKHPTWHASKGLAFEKQLVAILQKHGLNSADAPVYIQSFELANLKTIKAMSPVKRVYLLDGDEVKADGTVVSSRPYDFVKSGDSRVYGDMMSEASLKEIAQVANGIGPWKVYISSYRTDDKGVQTRIAPTDVVTRAHQAGLTVHPFTFRNEAQHLTASEVGDPYREYALFFDLGVDGLFSDYADTAVAARKRFAQ